MAGHGIFKYLSMLSEKSGFVGKHLLLCREGAEAGLARDGLALAPPSCQQSEVSSTSILA
jgi:hypothetical protein